MEQAASLHMGSQSSVEKPATSECLLDVLYTEYKWNMSILKVSLSVVLSSCRVAQAPSKAKFSANAISPLVQTKNPAKMTFYTAQPELVNNQFEETCS